MEKLLLEALFEHRREKKVIWNSQHGFTKGKLGLISQHYLPFYSLMTGSVYKGKECHCGFSKAFDILCYCIFLVIMLR